MKCTSFLQNKRGSDHTNEEKSCSQDASEVESPNDMNARSASPSRFHARSSDSHESRLELLLVGAFGADLVSFFLCF